MNRLKSFADSELEILAKNLKRDHDAVEENLLDDVIEEIAERQSDLPHMALRPDSEFPDELDDVVVKDVTMFRAEAMSHNEWWLCCYLPNGERITFWINKASRPARIVMTATEIPDYYDIDEKRNK